MILTVSLNLNATSNDILNIQKVDGSTLYDSLTLTFNNIDKSSILKCNNIDILASLNLKALSSNVYTKQDINDKSIMVTNSLNTKADKVNTS